LAGTISPGFTASFDMEMMFNSGFFMFHGNEFFHIDYQKGIIKSLLIA